MGLRHQNMFFLRLFPPFHVLINQTQQNRKGRKKKVLFNENCFNEKNS